MNIFINFSLIIFGIICILFGCQMHNKKNELQNKLHNSITENKIENTLYIYHHILTEEEYLNKIIVSESILEKSNPSYFKFSSDSYFSFPLGGNTYQSKKFVCSFLNCKLNSIKLKNCEDLILSKNYSYDYSYFQHSEAVKKLMLDYNYDLSKHRVTSNIIELDIGTKISEIYLYGTFGENDEFKCINLSTDPNLLINHIHSFTLDDLQIFFGIILICFALIFTSF